MATRRLNRSNINPCYHNSMEAGRPGRMREHQQYRCSNGQWKPSFNSRAVTATAYRAQSDNHVHHLAIGAAVAARTVTATVTSVLVAVSIVAVILITVKTAVVTATVTTDSATVAATGAAAAPAMAAVTGAVAVRTTLAAGAGLLHRVVYNQSVRRPTRQFVVEPHTERLSILRRR